MPCGSNLTPIVLTGVPQATLQLWLADAQNAYAKISTGQKEVSITVTGGGQHREVVYDRANMGALTNWIFQLQQALGNCRARRRAFGVRF